MRESFVAYGKLIQHGVPEPIVYNIVQRTHIHVYEAKIIDYMDNANNKSYLRHTKLSAVDQLMCQIIHNYCHNLMTQLAEINYVIIGIDDMNIIFAMNEVDANELNQNMSSVRKYRWVNIENFGDVLAAVREALMRNQEIDIEGIGFCWKKRSIS